MEAAHVPKSQEFIVSTHNPFEVLSTAKVGEKAAL